MRIEAFVNGTKQFLASLNGAGYLSAHLNLADRPKDQSQRRILRVEGFDTNSPTETISLKWPVVELFVGDVVELRLLEDGGGDPPIEQASGSELPSNLFASQALADELLSTCRKFESQLIELLRKSEQSEPAGEHGKFELAVGHVVANLGDRFLYPVYRRHPDLVPDELKGELL